MKIVGVETRDSSKDYHDSLLEVDIAMFVKRFKNFLTLRKTIKSLKRKKMTF